MKIFDNDKGRLESFSDAVFAFAATLLVVSLEVPDTFEVLKTQLKGIFSFGVSFGALVLIWRAHYSFFIRTTYRDNFIMIFNTILLFVVLYFVYPLKFLANMMFSNYYFTGKNSYGIRTADDLSELFILYGIGIILIFFCFSMMYWRAEKKSSDDKIKLAFFKRHFSIFVFVGILSVLLSFLKVGMQWGLPGSFYALLGPLCYFHGKWTGKKTGIKF